MIRISVMCAALLGLCLGGCLTNTYLYPCDDPDKGHKDADGNPDPCHFNDPPPPLPPPPPPAVTCAGDCVRLPPFGWEGPGLLWVGSTNETPPDCPERAPVVGYDGHADLVAPNECPVCSCEPPIGSCELPATIAAHAAICPGVGAQETSFDPPAGWDGSCSDVNAIPQGLDCGGVPCVQSVTVAPLSVVESECNAVQGPPPTPLGSSYWQTFGRACKGIEDPAATCGEPGLFCVPAAGRPPSDFRQCIYKEGDEACPTEAPEFSERFVLFKEVDDKRDCTPCDCGQPMGSTCSAPISFFSDSSCSSTPILTLTGMANMPNCGGVPAGAALGSKAAGPATYTPGVCQASGGEPVGAAEPIKPSTFCCMPKL